MESGCRLNSVCIRSHTCSSVPNGLYLSLSVPTCSGVVIYVKFYSAFLHSINYQTPYSIVQTSVRYPDLTVHFPSSCTSALHRVSCSNTVSYDPNLSHDTLLRSKHMIKVSNDLYKAKLKFPVVRTSLCKIEVPPTSDFLNLLLHD